MHEVLVNRLGGLSLPRKSVVRLTDRPDMTLDVYRGRKTTKQQQKSDNMKTAAIRVLYKRSKPNCLRKADNKNALNGQYFAGSETKVHSKVAK